MNDMPKTDSPIVPTPAVESVPQAPVFQRASRSLLSRTIDGLNNAINRTVSFLSPPPVRNKPVFTVSSFPAPPFVRTCFVTDKDIRIWHTLVSNARGEEIVWGLLGFTTTQGDVYIAETLVPDHTEHRSSFGGTQHLANPRLAELCTWYSAAWALWQAQGKVPTDVNFNFIGFGHCHPPGVTSLSQTDINTIHNALFKGMNVFVAPLCIMDYASSPVILPEKPHLLKVSVVQELTIKVFTGVNGDALKSPYLFRPVESEIVITDRMPYSMPPTSWHITALDQLVALQKFLSSDKYKITMSWTINSDFNAELPFVDIAILQEAWTNNILIRTPHNFPRSAPVVTLVSNDPNQWGATTPVTGVWNGSSNILDIIDNIAKKGLI